MADEVLSKILYEKLLIQYAFKDEVVRDTLTPYLDPEVFANHSNAQIIKSIMDFMEKHEHFPRINEMKLFMKNSEAYDHLLSIMDIDTSEYDREFILGELEEFYRKSLLANVIIESQENIGKDSSKLQELPSKMMEALNFSFDTDIGLSFMDDCDKMYESLHCRDKIVPTNVKSINKLIDGGFHEKTLNIVMGASNIGKSAVLCSFATDFLLQNKNVLYLSLEMSEEKVSERILANMFDTEMDFLKMMDKDKFKKKHEAIKKHLKSNLVIIQRGAKTVSSNKLRQILKDLKRKKKFVPDVVCVDYLGLMVPNNNKKDNNTYTEQKTISEELRAVMVEEDIVGMTAVQTNRSGYNNVELDLTSISDSIGVVATCDTMFGISQSDELKAAGRFNFSLLKNRYGPNNIRIFVGINYAKMRVYDVEDLDTLNIPTTKEKLVDDAAIEVLQGLGSNRRERKNQVLGIE